ncbi:uncharacterized protein CcaverHIS019_0401550 [Cutaneotrichosporon cavernicola]|uniref:Uncharacterized protein n=1 Tax=Cutaneotrichosporon cavernicola TaxID=279322 RepID=A0AA48QVH2_9TREE|nr:uncharacterized protein CcaverHIS019_0401550 [Cutaneotrichosporon cavernicola]BEI91335.1 hypothetical protein CcaverHIS019_0401550 [Cutaneotrichosporon cavernicola]BEI99108.1 hypothetical protein CcaverHIS631_0401510 [Cutaneotrichosporon cavernicola]
MDGLPIRTSRRPANLRRAGPRPGDAGTHAVGGDMVNSMKRRGLRPSKWVLYRPWVLVAVALVLLLILNTAWLQRINRRVVSKGGWDHVVPSARRHVAGWVENLAARIDSGVKHDEM